MGIESKIRFCRAESKKRHTGSHGAARLTYFPEDP